MNYGPCSPVGLEPFDPGHSHKFRPIKHHWIWFYWCGWSCQICKAILFSPLLGFEPIYHCFTARGKEFPLAFDIQTIKSEPLLWNIGISQKNHDTALYSWRLEPTLLYVLRTDYQNGNLVLHHNNHSFSLLQIVRDGVVGCEPCFNSWAIWTTRVWGGKSAGRFTSPKCLAGLNLKICMHGRNEELLNHTFVMKRYLINTT